MRKRKKSELKLKTFDAELENALRETVEAQIKEAVRVEEKHARQDAIDAVIKAQVERYEEDETVEVSEVKGILQMFVKEEVRRLITVDKVRPDGRGVDEIRHLIHRFICCHVHMVQACLHVDKLKR